MFKLAIKKVLNNKLLMVSLFAGILAAVLIACTIPVYSAGISHRMFVTQLETYQNENNISPGTLILNASLPAFRQTVEASDIASADDSASNLKNFEYCNSYLNNELYPKMNMPALINSTILSTTTMQVGDSRDLKKYNVNKGIIKATKDYSHAVKIISGEMPDSELNDGCVEVMISSAYQASTRFTVGTVLEAGVTKADILNGFEPPLKMKVVGIFDYLEDSYNPIPAATEQGIEIYCDYDLFFDYIFKEKNLVSKATWYFTGDYTQYNLDKLQETIDALNDLNKKLTAWGLDSSAKAATPPLEQYQTYSDNYKAVNVLLIFFYAPIMIMIIFFIFMISKFVTENDKNEISMLNSRGASRVQVLLLYLCQGGILTLIGILIAPLISLLLCGALGNTSGFLEFSQRAPMKISISFSSVLFGIIAGVLSVITMLVPVYKASKVEIVQQKRSRNNSGIISKIVLLIVALLLAGIAAYSYYVLVVQREGLITENGGIQPLAYLLLICAFASVAILLVLAYPLLLTLILKLGRKRWGAEKYSAFSRIASMQVRERFIVIFLTVTVAIGMFSSICARTLNKNMDNSAAYNNPVDIIADVKVYNASKGFVFDKLEDTEAIKVIIGKNPSISAISGKRETIENIQFRGISPTEFRKTVIWDDSILPNGLKYYTDLLENNPTGCIISKNTAERLNVKVNDTVNVKPDSSLEGRFVIHGQVLAIVDAWPMYYEQTTNEYGITTDNYLVICNLSQVEKSVSTTLKYQVWMNTDKSVDELKTFASDNYLKLENIKNGARERYLSTINSVRQATNGSLTLGFIAVIAVCIIGFVIYWVLSIKSRTLQIGTMRALGMSLKNVYAMVVWEQILLCTASIILGIASGIITGVMFAPLLQSAFGTMGGMPPYVLAYSLIDILKLVFAIAMIIVAGTASAFAMLKHIKAASAIKLGEE